MSSYLSGLLTTTTSRYNSLRGLIGVSEADGDTPDDTHLCRVLRSYYTEKARPFPAWLPADPKAPQPVQPVYAQPVGAGYGGLQQGAGASASKLGSLWDSQPANAQQQAPTSLRQQARGGSANSLRPQPGAQRDPYSRSQTVEPPVQARPLPSQRVGSYQATPPGSAGGAGAASGGGTAQDRLKARLWGAAKTAQGASSPQTSPAVVQAASAFARTNSYGTTSSGNGGGGNGGNYEDSFAPPSSDRRGAYAPPSSPYIGGGQDSEAAYGTNAPRQPPAGGGLPSGPRRGLPSGPRPPR